MKVIILGGTGLIGYHAALELHKNAHQVTIVSRGSIVLDGLFPPEITTISVDVFKLDSSELTKLLSGFDSMVYALGPDDRDIPDAPAYDYFYEKLVQKCEAICRNAKSAGVKRIIILSSYFAYFHRHNPDWQLAEHHPYIKCRIEQAEACLKLADSMVEIKILELPYVFGIMPNRDPLWKDLLVSRINKMRPWIFYTSGGTTMISVKLAAEAISGAVEIGRSGIYTVGDANLSWKEMLAIATKALYGKERRVITIPTAIAQLYGKYEKALVKKQGKETGLDYSKIIQDIQSKYTYLPDDLITTTAQELNLKRGGIDDAIRETFERCRE